LRRVCSLLSWGMLQAGTFGECLKTSRVPMWSTKAFYVFQSCFKALYFGLLNRDRLECTCFKLLRLLKLSAVYCSLAGRLPSQVRSCRICEGSIFWYVIIRFRLMYINKEWQRWIEADSLCRNPMKWTTDYGSTSQGKVQCLEAGLVWRHRRPSLITLELLRSWGIPRKFRPVTFLTKANYKLSSTAPSRPGRMPSPFNIYMADFKANMSKKPRWITQSETTEAYSWSNSPLPGYPFTV
jgi:hypothetical protein